MILLDRFLDTKAKRNCCFRLLYLILACWIICTYLKTALSLLHIHTYEEVFQALTNGLLEGSYLSRIVLSWMSMSVFQLSTVLSILIKSLRLADILFFLGTILLFISDLYRNVRSSYAIIMVGFIIQFILIGAIALWATHADSLLSLIQDIRLIGWCILGMQSLLMLYCFNCVWKSLKAYREALAYEVMEIKDDK